MFNKSNIMKNAHNIYRKNNGKITWGEALHRAWNCAKSAPINSQRIADAKAKAGVTEETHSWSDWKKLGFEVNHESKALFGCDLIFASRGDGKIYKATFFGRSQVHEIELAVA